MNLDSFKYFYPERPRLLHIEQPLFDTLSDHPDWIAEPKYNGSRLQLHYLNGAWQFWNRHEQKMNYTPSPEVEEALATLSNLNLKGYWLFDGELRHNKTKGVRHKIMLYDVFIREGELLTGHPFWMRREILEELVLRPPLDLPMQHRAGFRGVFGRFIENEELEGLVIKNIRGQLQLGRGRAVESKWMWKIRKPSGRYNF